MSSAIPSSIFSSYSPSSSDFPQSASGASSTQPDQPSPSTTSTTTTSTSDSSTPATSPTTALLPSTLTSSSASTSAVTSTSSSATSAPVAVAQPQSSSSSTPTPIISSSSAGASTQALFPSSPVLASPTATPSSTPTHSSSSGFFSNTGAVAGTFTIVGLVCIAGVIAAVMFIANRRHSRSDGEDTEYLDKMPDFSPDHPITRGSSVDDGSDHAQYGAPPIPLPPPPTVYYPDHAYALHPHAFAPEAYFQPSPDAHPVPSAQNYAPQRIYSPEDYDIAYPPLDPRLGAHMRIPHQFTDVELDSAPVPLTQTALPGALRPSVKSNPSAPADIRFSVDSFYTGIVKDTPQPLGQAL